MSCPDCEFVYEMGSSMPVASVCETCRPHDPVLWTTGNFVPPPPREELSRLGEVIEALLPPPSDEEIASLLRTLTAVKEETGD